MNDATLLHLTLEALILTLMLSLPPIIVAAVFGIAVALFQAVTQIQEQVLSFTIKLVAVIVTLTLTARWAGMELLRYANRLFEQFPNMVN
ncbi:MAG: EscS/YscS/HrcS family type III secretion system export apparatus protein [Desulfobacteraceae bacterium]|nr:EscS/YscS/HrcS family type III secretion system export apparatus protein [Desulfobacteraceae bacterium]